MHYLCVGLKTQPEPPLAGAKVWIGKEDSDEGDGDVASRVPRCVALVSNRLIDKLGYICASRSACASVN